MEPEKQQGALQWFRAAPRAVRAVGLVLFGAAVALGGYAIVNALTGDDAIHPTVTVSKPTPEKFSGKKTPFKPATKPGVDPQLQAGVTPHEVKGVDPGKGFRATSA